MPLSQSKELNGITATETLWLVLQRIEKVAVEGPADLSALSEVDKVPLLIRMGGLPFAEMFFRTEELYPQSEMVDEMGVGTVFVRENGVPFAQRIDRSSDTLHLFPVDFYPEIYGPLALRADGVDIGLGSRPIHDGDGDAAPRSHGIDGLLARYLHPMRTGNR
jgi:hypothetical protein